MPTAEPILEERFKKLKACVLIPTYNNAGTLPELLGKVLNYTRQVVVVNDGSTDGTVDILAQFPEVNAVSYSPNKGKGIALRAGFKEAYKLGYDHAITIDSDGQHYPSDLVKFLDQLEITPDALIIGARNMDQDNVPGKSSFGNRFSNFWFWVNTGNTLPDTQSGYRSYPLKSVVGKRYNTSKYEFEIEVIVRAAWSGVPVISIPVSVYYPSPEERVSHFRPLKDFTRISVLNTFLVLIALLWIKPRDFVRLLMKKEGWKTMWRMLFVNPLETNHTKAASVGFGFFMGIVPVWGFQLAIGIPLTMLFRLNKALFLLSANVSIFPFTPFIWMASLMTGKWVLGYDAWALDWHTLTLERVTKEGLAFFLGGTVLSIVMGASTYLLTLGILALTRRKKV
jgi:glycosyltransferase involved in cell wall biosynthesis